MNRNALKGLIISQGYTIENFLLSLKSKGISLSKKTFYRKIKCETEFNRVEIIAIANELNMSDEKIMEIFFNETVS